MAIKRFIFLRKIASGAAARSGLSSAACTRRLSFHSEWEF
jgi:hypothetical protein